MAIRGMVLGVVGVFLGTLVLTLAVVLPLAGKDADTEFNCTGRAVDEDPFNDC